MRADLDKLAQVIRPTTEDESRAAGLARSVGDMHLELETEIQELAERRWLAENSDALESSNAFVEEQGLPLAPYEAVTERVRADYARMQHPVFAALSNALESTVPEKGFGKFRGGRPPESDDAEKNE